MKNLYDQRPYEFLIMWPTTVLRGEKTKNSRIRSTSFPSYWGPILLSRNKQFTNSKTYLNGTDVQYSSFNSIQGCTNL